ncbi:MAG: nuclear transport factor 2 family protein [Solirubrobacteraceae bacterium]
MTMNAQATLDAYFDGINEERYDDVAALFAPHATLIAPGIERCSGGEAIAAYFAAALRPYPQHRDEPTRAVLAGSVATVEIHFSGTMAGGVALEFDAVDVFDLQDDGRISRLSSWYDSHAVRAQLRAARAAADS